MTDQSELMSLVVVVVAFIAGYSIVSYVVRKLKARHSASDDQGHNDSSPPTEDTQDLK